MSMGTEQMPVQASELVTGITEGLIVKNFSGKSLSQAEFKMDGSNSYRYTMRYNGNPVTTQNPIPNNGESELFKLSDLNKKFESGELFYKFLNEPTQFKTGSYKVARNDDYLVQLQMTVNPPTNTESYIQAQIDVKGPLNPFVDEEDDSDGT